MAQEETTDARDLALKSAEVLLREKGEDVRILDVRDALCIVDYFVIATGRNPRHLRALADHLRRLTRDELGLAVPREEGTAGGGRWLLLDLGDVIVHLFDAETRAYYDLEGLWADAPRLAAP